MDFANKGMTGGYASSEGGSGGYGGSEGGGGFGGIG